MNLERPHLKKEQFPKKTNKVEGRENEAEFLKDYFSLLRAYNRKFNELKKVGRRFPGAERDPEVVAAKQIIDDERHQIHLQLLEAGQRLGKDKYGVLADLIRSEGTLEEYGLPEFTILKNNDLRKDYLNLGPEKLRPQPVTEEDEHERLADIFWGEDLEEYKTTIIVFATTPYINEKMNDLYDGRSYYGGIPLEPVDLEVRVSRAKKLAEKTNTKFVEPSDGIYHEMTVEIAGVEVPNERLEEVASIIRNNPQKFRLGMPFYTKDEKVLVEEHTEEILEEAEDIGNEARQKAYFAMRKKLFGEEPPSPKK